MSTFDEKPGEDLSRLRQVSDTAWMVAALRARESDRQDALFNDPYAQRLAGRRGPALVSSMTKGYDLSWFMAVRTKVLDDLTAALVQERRLGGVVNLACGLDTRAYRLALPPSLLWIDADLPDVIDYRVEALRTARSHCRVEQHKVDLSDDGARRALLREAGMRMGSFLVITEGLLIYLTADNVAALARDLQGGRAARVWLTDFYGGKTWVDESSGWRDRMKAENAEVRFLPEGGAGFFAQHGWRVGKQLPFLKEGARLGRLPPPMSAAERAAVGFDLTAMWSDSHMLILERLDAEPLPH